MPGTDWCIIRSDQLASADKPSLTSEDDLLFASVLAGRADDITGFGCFIIARHSVELGPRRFNRFVEVGSAGASVWRAGLMLLWRSLLRDTGPKLRRLRSHAPLPKPKRSILCK